MSNKKSAPVSIAVVPPIVDEKALERTGAKLHSEIYAIVVKDQESYNIAALERGKLTQHIEYLDSLFGEAKKKLNAAVLDMRNLEKKIVGPRRTFAQGLLDSLNKRMSDWILTERDRVRREKEAADKIEAKRIADEKAKLLKQADKAEDKGKDAKAETLRNAAAAATFTPAPVKQATSFVGTGTSGREDIIVEIVDPILFLKYLLSRPNEDISKYVDFRYSEVKKFVKALGSVEAPGLKVEKKIIIVG